MAKIEYVNYLSDFKILESCKSKNLLPFVWIYKGGGGNEYSASFNGKEYKNCIKVSDDKILVLFKNHNLGIGPVSVFRKWIIRDTDFSDDKRVEWSEEPTNIVLGHYSTADTVITNTYIPPISIAKKTKQIHIQDDVLTLNVKSGMGDIVYLCDNLKSLSFSGIENVQDEVLVLFDTKDEIVEKIEVPPMTKHLGELTLAPNSSYMVSVQYGILVCTNLTLEV